MYKAVRSQPREQDCFSDVRGEIRLPGGAAAGAGSACHCAERSDLAFQAGLAKCLLLLEAGELKCRCSGQSLLLQHPGFQISLQAIYCTKLILTEHTLLLPAQTALLTKDSFS